jgi:hypothetical protein
MTVNAYTQPNGLPAGTDGSTYLIDSTTFYAAGIKVFMLANVRETQLVIPMSQPNFMRLIQLENTIIIYREFQKSFPD